MQGGESVGKVFFLGGMYTFRAGCSEISSFGSGGAGARVSGRSPEISVALSPWIPFKWLEFTSSVWDLSSFVCISTQSQFLGSDICKGKL